MDIVEEILDAVAVEGIDAALRYTRQFDQVDLSRDQLIWNPLAESTAHPAPDIKEALDYAIDRVRRFHRAVKPADRCVATEPGMVLEERWIPFQRVGVYVPNGLYPLVSSLIMTAVPAQEAGVEQIVAAISPRGGLGLDESWLYVLQTLQISQVIRLGGAQAIAALGYGLEGLLPVDFVAGPGNRYVAEAKRELQRRGRVGIDGYAGPSEVMVLANDVAYVDVVWSDLLAQAEHDRMASAELVTTNRQLADAIRSRLGQRPEGMGNITVTRVENLEEAMAIVNERAPEHLGLMGADVESLQDQVRTAGALFIGPLAGQALGDYVAGPSHVLPTGGSGRFQSGLSTSTFCRHMSVIRADAELDGRMLEMGSRLAKLEGLRFHEASLTLRRAFREGGIIYGRTQSRDYPDNSGNDD